MNYQWLFFDADGTLFDYDQAEASALEGAFRDFLLPFDAQSSDVYRRINHQIWLDFENGQITAEVLRVRRFERLFEALHIRVSPVEFSERYLQNLAWASDLMTGAEETVQALHGKYRLAIITNGLKEVQRSRLERSGLAGYFDVVAISDELGVAKPDPRFFAAVFEQIGNPEKESVLVIGDSLTSDIQGGIRVGLDTCWFNPSGKPPDPKFPATYEIHALEQLLHLLI